MAVDMNSAYSAVNPLRVKIDGAKQAKLVVVSETVNKTVDKSLLSAYKSQDGDSAPNAAIDKLKGVLNLGDLNNYRTDAGGEADLDEKDLGDIKNLAFKGVANTGDTTYADFVRNAYMKYLAEQWDNLPHIELSTPPEGTGNAMPAGFKARPLTRG